MFYGVLLLIISTLFWTHALLLLWSCFIHHNATILSLQQYVDVTLTSSLTASSTVFNNSDNNKHDNSSSLGMVNDFDGTNRLLLTNKLTVSLCSQRFKMYTHALYASPEVSQKPCSSIFLFPQAQSTWRRTETSSSIFSPFTKLFHNKTYSWDTSVSQSYFATQILWKINFD